MSKLEFSSKSTGKVYTGHKHDSIVKKLMEFQGRYQNQGRFMRETLRRIGSSGAKLPRRIKPKTFIGILVKSGILKEEKNGNRKSKDGLQV